jgi:type II secretory pathway predicted ATPase ExeA
MYQAHFGLKKPLFDSGIAQDAAVFLAPKHDEIAGKCKLAFTTSDSAVVLTGPAGVGKTTLMSAVLRTTSTRLALGWITVAPANAAELLELLLVELGVNAHRMGRVERMQMWRQFLNESSATSSRVYVIAERADELGVDVLRALDSLTAADANGSLGANVVLLGQPPLLDLLKSPALDSLRQRIRLRERLDPLTSQELRAYLDQHAKLAGGQLSKIFTQNAVMALHELSGGIPRFVNNLCESALELAATRKEPLVTNDLVRHVAVSMLGIEPPRALEAAVAAPASAERAQAEQKPSPPPARTSADDKPVATPVSAPAEDKPNAPVAERAAQVLVAREPVGAREPVATAQPPRPIEPPVRPTTEPPVVAPTPAVSQAKPAMVSIPRAAPTVSAPAPTSATATAPEPAAARPARAPQPAPAPGPATPTNAAPATPVPPSAAPTQAAAPARPVASLVSGPPDADLDAFADTLTDSPDVPMLDFPVLTDAVEPARARPRADTAYLKPPVAQTPAVAAAKPATPLPRVVAPASTPTQAPRAARPVQAAPGAQPTPAATLAKPAPPPPAQPSPPPAPGDDDLLRQTQTMRGLMAAKSIDDISDSMAETLFGEADLDMLSAALAASGFSDDEASASASASASTSAPTPASEPTTKPAAKPAAAPKAAAPAEEDPFDFLGLGPDAPLELIDDPEPAPAQRKEGTRNR